VPREDWIENAANVRNLAPPVLNDPMQTPARKSTPFGEANTPDPAGKQQLGTDGTDGSAFPITASESRETAAYYDTGRPTCSLNLVCYRSGSRGCDVQQIQCILRSKFPDDESFDATVASNPQLVSSDVQFFQEIRRRFEKNMSGLFRRYLSLKSHRTFRILAVSCF
jgi:hypothetical protein